MLQFGSVKKERSAYWSPLTREQNIFGKEDQPVYVCYLNLPQLLLFYISESLP